MEEEKKVEDGLRPNKKRKRELSMDGAFGVVSCRLVSSRQIQDTVLTKAEGDLTLPDGTLLDYKVVLSTASASSSSSAATASSSCLQLMYQQGVKRVAAAQDVLRKQNALVRELESALAANKAEVEHALENPSDDDEVSRVGALMFEQRRIQKEIQTVKDSTKVAYTATATTEMYQVTAHLPALLKGTIVVWVPPTEPYQQTTPSDSEAAVQWNRATQQLEFTEAITDSTGQSVGGNRLSLAMLSWDAATIKCFAGELTVDPAAPGMVTGSLGGGFYFDEDQGAGILSREALPDGGISYWKVSVTQAGHWVMLGISFTHPPMRARSYLDPGCYGWAGSRQVYIGGTNNSGHGRWTGFQASDVAHFRWDPVKRKLALWVERLGLTQVFTISTAAAHGAGRPYIATNLYFEGSVGVVRLEPDSAASWAGT